MTTPRKIPFKTYCPKQAMLLLPSLDDMIPANDPVRVVDRVVDQIQIHLLISTYIREAAVRGTIPACCSKCLSMQKVYNTELQEQETPDFTEIFVEKVEETIRQINQKLKDREIEREVKKSLTTGQNTGQKTCANTSHSNRY